MEILALPKKTAEEMMTEAVELLVNIKMLEMVLVEVVILAISRK